MRHRLRTLRRETSGVTIVEFAMILPALCVVLLGIFEIGWRQYVSSIVQGTLHEAARMATVGGKSTTDIDNYVKGRLRSFSHAATVTTSTRSYDEFSAVGTPELITSDTAPTGQFNPGDCYEDFNNNNSYDLDRGRSGLGGADDIVRYEVTISYPRMFPIAAFLGWGNTESVTSNTVLRNQPYAGRSTATPPVRCTSP